MVHLLQSGEQYPVHEKSDLVFRQIANALKIVIYLFSANRKPQVYPRDMPQKPEIAIGILDATSSFHTIGNPFSVLSVSPHIHPMDLDLPVPPSLVSSTSSSPSPTESPPHITTYRPHRRRPAPPKDLSFPGDDSSLWRPSLRDACVTKLDGFITSAVEGVLKKRGLADDAKETELENKKRILYNDLIGRDDVPRGTRPIILANARERCSAVPEKLETNHLHRRLADAGGVQVWKNVVEETFEDKWTETQKKAQSTPQATGTGRTGTRRRPASKNESITDVTPSTGPSLQAGPASIESPSEWQGTISRELSQCIQPWLLPHLETLDSIAIKSQKHFTNLMRELAFLVHKGLFVISKGDVFTEPGKQSPALLIHLQDLAPTLNSDDTVDVAPLPQLFQGALQGSDDQRKHPAASLFTQGHLQDLFFAFCAVGRDNHRTDGAQPGTPRHLWDRITDEIKARSDTGSIMQVEDGYSRLTTTMIRQLSAAVQRIWTGPLFNKMFDRLVNTVVRERLKHLNMATATLPVTRELVDTKEGAVHTTGAEAEDPPEAPLKTITMSAWRRRSRSLCDELNKALGMPGDDVRHDRKIHVIEYQMSKHLLKKPTPKSFKFRQLTRKERASRIIGNDGDGAEEDEDDDENNGEDGDDGEDDNDGPSNGVRTKDKGSKPVSKTRTFSQRVKWLAKTLKNLLESPAIDMHLNRNWLKKSDSLGLKGSDVTDDELNILVKIATILRPYVPKRVKVDGESHTKPAPALVVLRINASSCLPSSPLVHDTPFHWVLSSFKSQWNSAPGHFDAHQANGSSVFPCDLQKVMSSPENRLDYLRSFFNIDALQTLCKAYNYTLRPRLVYNTLNKDGRKGHPSKSHLDERRKQRFGKPAYDRSYWEQQYLNSSLSKDEIDQALEYKQQEVNTLDAEVKSISKRTKKLEREKSNAAIQAVGPWTPSFRFYTRAQRRFWKAYAEQQQQTETLDQAKKDLTWLRQVRIVAHSKTPPNPKALSLTKATTDYRRFEEDAQHLDISELINNPNIIKAWGATDYGVKRMSETVVLPTPVIQPHMNQFAVLEDLGDEDSNNASEALGQLIQEPVEHSLVAAGGKVSKDQAQKHGLVEKLARVPKTHTITAPQISAICHSASNAHRRQRRLRLEKNHTINIAIDNLKKPAVVPLAAKSLQDLDNALVVHRRDSPLIESFENSHRRLKELRTQHRRTGQALQIVTAHERRLIIRQARTAEGGSSEDTYKVSTQDGWCTQCSEHHRMHLDETLQYVYDPVCPKELKEVAVILLIGNAGTGVGSFIGGIEKRGGKRLRHHHMRSAIVCITNEFRTSKTCSLCLWRVTLARSRRLVDGKLKAVRVNGAVECHNQACPSVQKGYCIKSRDGNAALNIGLAGISTLTRPSRKTLSQFSQRPTTQPCLFPAPASSALVSTSPSGLATTKYSSTHLDETFSDISAHQEQTPAESTEASVKDATGIPASLAEA
ncbi:hypothetical protein BG003_008915 [Podila horticola]|nr:hypothetical protein BG003_008915 [Podila horticola]